MLCDHSDPITKIVLFICSQNGDSDCRGGRGLRGRVWVMSVGVGRRGCEGCCAEEDGGWGWREMEVGVGGGSSVDA